jgi:hypothetical protein
MKCASYRTHEKSQLALMERAPPSLVADHVRSLRKRHRRFLEPIDSVVTASRDMNRSVNIWPQRETLSSAARTFRNDGPLLWQHLTPQLSFDRRMVGNINAAAEVACERTLPIISRTLVRDLAKNVGMAPQAIRHCEWRPCSERGHVSIDAALKILRMDPLGPTVADLVLHLPADKIQPRLIEPVTQCLVFTKARRRWLIICALATVPCDGARPPG